MTQFVSFDAAEVFIVKKRLRKNGIKAYIIGDEELLDQEKEIIGISVKPLDVDVYYIENDKEEKLYYNVENDSYFFQAGIIGFAFWYTEQEATTAKDVFATAGTVKKIDKAPASDN